MDKALNYLALARKGGIAELGEEPVGAITRAGKGYLVLVASDASDHTWRRAKSFVAGTEQQCIRVSFSKDELGFAVGRTSLAIAAVTDPALALALVMFLHPPLWIGKIVRNGQTKPKAYVIRRECMFVRSKTAYNKRKPSYDGFPH